MVHVRRKIPAIIKTEGSLEQLVNALILHDEVERGEAYRRQNDCTKKAERAALDSKIMYLKRSHLNTDILSYLRAHLLVRYEG